MADLTLLEQVKTLEDPQAVRVVNVFATSYPVLELLAFEQISGPTYPLTVFDRLPTSTPREYGADFTPDYGKCKAFILEVKNYGGKLSIDRNLAKVNPKGAREQGVLQIQGYAKRAAADIFEGAGGTSIVGIGSQIAQMFPTQVVNGASTTANGDVLTTALLDAALNKCDADAIFMTSVVHNRLTNLATSQNNLVWALDGFGRQVLTYNGVPIYRMIDQYTSADVLSTTERDGADANNTTSSVWLVNFGEMGLRGFSPANPVAEVVTVDSGTQNLITRLDVPMGVVLPRPRAACRIVNIKQAVA